jgi:hypothetical protein
LVVGDGPLLITCGLEDVGVVVGAVVEFELGDVDGVVVAVAVAGVGAGAGAGAAVELTDRVTNDDLAAL